MENASDFYNQMGGFSIIDNIANLIAIPSISRQLDEFAAAIESI